MKNVFETLLDKLFQNPCPQPNNPEVGKIYRSLYNRMFPDEDKFILFLSTQDIGLQYKTATYILEDLCLVSNFPPSIWALEDILTIEDIRKRITVENRNLGAKENYTLRDHYLHLVQLYLLGIYIYFYNEKVYYGINEINQNARLSSQYENKKYLVCKDFISEWKYFCLYHDVGYADEIIKNEKVKSRVKLKEDCPDFKESIDDPMNASLHHSIMATIEIMSKVLIADLVIDYSNEKRKVNIDHTIKSIDDFLENKSTRLSGYAKKAIPKDLNTDVFMRIQKIYSNRILKYILTLFSTNEIMVVVSSKLDGSIVLVSIPTKNKRKSFYNIKWRENEEINAYIQNSEMLFFDDLYSQAFEFAFYIYTNSSVQDRINTLYENADCSHWKRMLSNLRLKYREDFLSTFNEKQVTQLYLQIYYGFESEFVALFGSPSLLRSSKKKIHSDVHETLINRHLESIKDDYGKRIVKILFPDDSKDSKPNYTSIDSIFVSYKEKACKNKKAFTDHSISEMTAAIKKTYISNISADSDYMDVFLDLQRTLLKKFDSSNKSINLNNVLKEYSLAKFKCLYGTEFANRLIDDFPSAYEYKYGNVSDHGVVSASYAARILSMYQNLIEEQNSNSDKWLYVLLDITDTSRLHKQYIDNYSHVFSNIISAVFLHNLTISQFKDDYIKKLKVKSSDSFTYFAMLCDALQQWNRPYSELQYQSRFLSDNASDAYNIEVDNGIVYVFENSDEESQERLKKNINSLSDYMSDVRAIVDRGQMKKKK